MFPRLLFIVSTIIVVILTSEINGFGEATPLDPSEYSKVLSLLNSMLSDAGLPIAVRLTSGTKHQRTSGIVYQLNFENVNQETCEASLAEDRQNPPTPPEVSCYRVC